MLTSLIRALLTFIQVTNGPYLLLCFFEEYNSANPVYYMKTDDAKFMLIPKYIKNLSIVVIF